MRIESITVRGFGCLSEKRYEFPDGKAVVIIEENERGKSTLTAAILAGLCGFPPRKVAGEVVKLADVYKPWDADVYGVEMEITAGGRRLGILRDFTKSTPLFRDLETNQNVTSQLDCDLTAHFLQLPREDFQRIAVVQGKEIQRFNSSPNLQSRLSALVEGSSGDTGAEVAVDLLNKATYPLDGKAIKPETAIQRLMKEIEEKTRRMAALDADLEAADTQVRALDEGHARQKELQEQLAGLDAEYTAARLAEVRERIAEARSIEEERSRLTSELASLEDTATFPAERQNHLTTAAALVRDCQEKLNEELARQRTLESDADALRVRLESENRFTSASRDDQIALASAQDTLTDAERSLNERQNEIGRAKASGSSGLAKAITALGLATGLAGVVLLVLRLLDPVPSISTTVLGILVAAIGAVQMARQGAGLSVLQETMRQAERSYEDAADRAKRRLSAIGVDAAANDDLAEQLRRVQDALIRYLDDRERLADTETRLLDVSRTIARIRGQMEDEDQAIRSIVSSAGIDPSLAVEDALRAFEEAGKRHGRYCEVKNVLIPAIERRRAQPAAIEALVAEEKHLLESLPDQSSVRPAARRPAEIDNERQRARSELEKAVTQTTTLEREVGLTVESYRREYPQLRQDVDELRSGLSNATRFHQATETAAQVLREVAESTRRRWSAALNEQAGAILPNLNPDYTDIRFDDSLGFTLCRTSDNRPLEKSDVDARLSTGARDQVYLAVRLACCLELSKNGEPLPIILDDPLLASDDARFESAMRYLVDQLPESNQVIILSCHRLRHERLMSQPWFADRAVLVPI